MSMANSTVRYPTSSSKICTETNTRAHPFITTWATGTTIPIRARTIGARIATISDDRFYPRRYYPFYRAPLHMYHAHPKYARVE